MHFHSKKKKIKPQETFPFFFFRNSHSRLPIWGLRFGRLSGHYTGPSYGLVYYPTGLWKGQQGKEY